MSDSNLSAMSSLGVAQEVTANNVANVNTDGFKASSVVFEAGPNDQGTFVAAINQSTNAGPMINGVQGSNTDLGTEMVDMMTTGGAFSANATFIRVSEEMTGHLLNMIV